AAKPEPAPAPAPPVPAAKPEPAPAPKPEPVPVPDSVAKGMEQMETVKEAPAMEAPTTMEAEAPAMEEAAPGEPSSQVKEMVARRYAPAKSAAQEASKPYMSIWERDFLRIKAVQTRLKSLGLYDLKIDGDPGPVTRAGILQYQEMNSLTKTGIIDDEILKHMGID
ncbi:MAG: peptidoglycan-binding domain-containing protein, partial [Pseudomonadota bacterium]